MRVFEFHQFDARTQLRTRTRSTPTCSNINSLACSLLLIFGFCESFTTLGLGNPAIRIRTHQHQHHGVRSPSTLHSRKLSFVLNPSISSIPAEDWNACLQLDSSPFLEHAWLKSLEESGCASPETGWAPQHLSIQLNGVIQGYVPLYIKGHSMGEFIFDNSWAEAAYQLGHSYYPKLLVAVPFTPATGQRILLHPDVWEKYGKQQITQIRKAVATFLIQLAESNQLSSVHINFLSESEAIDVSGSLNEAPFESSTNGNTGGDKDDNSNEAEAEESPRLSGKVKRIFQRVTTTTTGGGVKARYLRRTSLQYHWINENINNIGKPYTSFEEYLGCFKSKRRISIKRERRRVLEEEDIRIDSVVGKDILKIDGLVERMFDIYLSTVERMLWGRQYLSMEFFQHLSQSDFIDNICFLCARPQSSGERLRAKDVFAGTINVVKNGVFYGRYWGCLQGREVKNLHFETCYWSAIDFCIRHGIQRMEPGAGGGGEFVRGCCVIFAMLLQHVSCADEATSPRFLDYKWARGFDPALIHSTHYIFDPELRRAIGNYLEVETRNNEELTSYLKGKSAVASKERKVPGL